MSTQVVPNRRARPHFWRVRASSVCRCGVCRVGGLETRSLNELRNTVVNLLQGLVEKGTCTRERARRWSSPRQRRRKKMPPPSLAQDKAEEGRDPRAVRSADREGSDPKEVAAELAPEVAKEVVEQAKSEERGAAGALPEWIRRVRWSGDRRFRGEGDMVRGRQPREQLISTSSRSTIRAASRRPAWTRSPT